VTAGRPRKSLEQHMLEGTYREDRHGPRPRTSTASTPMRAERESDGETFYPYVDLEYVPKLLVSAESLAKLLDVTRSTVRLWAKNGDMPQPHKIGGSSRWDADEIRDWIRAGCPDRDGETNGTQR